MASSVFFPVDATVPEMAKKFDELPPDYKEKMLKAIALWIEYQSSKAEVK
ncbi:hypothetical protein [Aphanothece hegewaldii]|nr:hypothetical protein [Aphanothece hegewaldii]